MSAHPFDPISSAELQLAVQVLKAAFPGVRLRFKVIDIREPIKKDVIPYLEAERLGKLLPEKPARIIHCLFHRLDTQAFIKALVNADSKTVISAVELPPTVQVCLIPS